MASSCTLVVRIYPLKPYSVHCIAGGRPSRQEHSHPPSFWPSGWTCVWQSPSRSSFLLSVWVCRGWRLLSSMRAGRGYSVFNTFPLFRKTKTSDFFEANIRTFDVKHPYFCPKKSDVLQLPNTIVLHLPDRYPSPSTKKVLVLRQFGW